MAHILIVEDEKPISSLIAMNLALVGHTCAQAFDGTEAQELMKENAYSLILMDIMLPGLDGFELIRHVPEGTPVIYLTAMGNVADKVRGLNLGADDYIVKPFETVELLARIDAILRRTSRSAGVFSLDGTVVNLSSRVVTVDGSEIELTLREFELLEVLIRHRNIALSREKLLQLAWSYDYYGETRTVDVHIQKLRKKLNWEDRIKTVYKLGYRLEAAV